MSRRDHLRPDDRTVDTDTEQLLADWFTDEAPTREPRVLVPTVIARTALTKRRSRWLIADWWRDLFRMGGRASLTLVFGVMVGTIAVLALLPAAFVLTDQPPDAVLVRADDPDEHTTREDQVDIAASPSPSPIAEEPLPTPPAAKVDYATGTLVETQVDWDQLDELMDAGSLPYPPDRDIPEAAGELWLEYPTLYTVRSTDPRLVGQAMLAAVAWNWDHTVTVDDLDEPRPFGLWRLQSAIGRLSIANAGGAWEGTIGPAFEAEGEDPADGVQGNAPSLDGRVPAVLIGRGDYAGLTAYVSFRDPDADNAATALVGGGAFEAVIVNEAPLAPVSDQEWAGMREWIDRARDAGGIE